MSDVDDFLAHYGVKGMKWGVRKSRPTSTARKAKPGKKPLTPEQRKARKEKIAAYAKLGVGILALLGPSVASTSVSALQSSANKRRVAAGEKAAADILSDSRGMTSYRTVALGYDADKGAWR